MSASAKKPATGQLISPSLAEFVRKIGLYPVARQVLFSADFLRNRRPNQEFKLSHPDVACPPARLLWKTAPTTNFEVYANGGREAAEAYYRLASENCSELRSIYEWGSGAGSVCRHLPAIDPNLAVYGSDYDPKLVAWCQANVPGVQFTLNKLAPPLSFADGSFDFVYSRSVYTHLSGELQKRWLQEQLRVTRPGGLVLLTVHGDAYMHRLTPEEKVEYETKGIVEHRTADDGGPWFVTFNSPSYMENTMLAGLEVVYRDVLSEEALGLRQDAWLVRKPA